MNVIIRQVVDEFLISSTKDDTRNKVAYIQGSVLYIYGEPLAVRAEQHNQNTGTSTVFVSMHKTTALKKVVRDILIRFAQILQVDVIEMDFPLATELNLDFAISRGLEPTPLFDILTNAIVSNNIHLDRMALSVYAPAYPFAPVLYVGTYASALKEYAKWMAISSRQELLELVAYLNDIPRLQHVLHMEETLLVECDEDNMQDNIAYVTGKLANCMFPQRMELTGYYEVYNLPFVIKSLNMPAKRK